MYRNFGSQGRGNPPYTGSGSGSLGGSSTSTTQQEQVGGPSFKLGYRLSLTDVGQMCETRCKSSRGGEKV